MTLGLLTVALGLSLGSATPDSTRPGPLARTPFGAAVVQVPHGGEAAMPALKVKRLPSTR